MSIFITADIHGSHSINKFSQRRMNYKQYNLTKDDYVIICGDFGLIWDAKQTKHEKYWLDWLGEKPWTTLFVDGNHECATRLDNDYPVEEWNGGKIHRITDSVFHLMRGQIFTLQDRTFFTLGGAWSHDIEYRTEGVSWWPREIPSFCEREEAIANLAAHDWKVDYVVTHDAPAYIAYQMLMRYYDPSRTLDEYELWLQGEIANKLDFKQWFFGHHHQDRELCDGKYRATYHDIVRIL